MHMCTQACTHTRTHVHMHAHARALHTPAVQDETTASASASVIQTTSGRSRGTCTRAALRDGNGQRHSTGWANRHFCNQCLPNFSRGLSQYIFGSYIQVLFLLSDFVTLKKSKDFKKKCSLKNGIHSHRQLHASTHRPPNAMPMASIIPPAGAQAPHRPSAGSGGGSAPSAQMGDSGCTGAAPGPQPPPPPLCPFLGVQ